MGKLKQLESTVVNALFNFEEADEGNDGWYKPVNAFPGRKFYFSVSKKSKMSTKKHFNVATKYKIR